MKKQLSHISCHQTSKVFSLMVFLITLILLIPMAIYAFSLGDKQQALVLLIGPFIYLLFAYITQYIWVWLYNLVAKQVGGIEFDLIDKE